MDSGSGSDVVAKPEKQKKFIKLSGVVFGHLLMFSVDSTHSSGSRILFESTY